MFSKISRYVTLATVVTVDTQGRLLPSTELRLLPEVTGTFRHTINTGDRLDQLGYKYYDQPRKWWRICDANPQFLSPLALLGQEGPVTVRIPLTPQAGSTPAWAALLANLRSLPGVEAVTFQEDVTQVAQQQPGPPPVTIWKDQLAWAVVMTYNPAQLDLSALRKAITDAKMIAGEQLELDRVGQPIVVPPDVIG